MRYVNILLANNDLSISNKYCTIKFDNKDKIIYGTDTENTNKINGIPAFYTRNKRNLKKAWDYLSKNLNNMKFKEVIDLLRNEFNLSVGTHYI